MEVLGVQIRKEEIECVLVRSQGATITVVATHTFLLNDVKQLYNFIETQCSKTLVIAAAINSENVLLRQITLPMQTRSQALKALPFQLEALLPMNQEESLISLILTKQAPAEWRATLFCSKETSLQELLTQLPLDPDFVTTPAIGLYKIAKHLYKEMKEGVIFSTADRLCIVIEKGEITRSQTLPSCEKKDLIRLKHFLEEHKIPLDTILLVGKNPALYKLWEEVFSTPPLPIDKNISSYALPLGIALSWIAQDAYTINLREGKWLSSKKQQQRTHTLLKVGALSLAATCIMWLGSSLFFHIQYRYLEKKLSTYLPKNLQQGPLNSPQHMEKTLLLWEKSVGAQKLPFPFLPNLPSASDILAWVSSHPALSTQEGLPKEGIEVQSVRYKLYQYPKLGGSKDPYLAKVEIEFTAIAPKFAREFHDALLLGDPIINAKKELGWSFQGNSYLATFEVAPRGGKG